MGEFLGPPLVLGECPRWDDAHAELSWVDVDGGTLHRARRTDSGWTGITTDALGVPLPGAVRRTGDDGWLVALGGGLARWDGNGRPVTVSVVDDGGAGCPVRLNEMVTDPAGRVWVGSMAYDWTPGAGSFFRLDPDGSVHRVLAGVTVANGVGWSPDGATIYVTDTAPGLITAHDYDPDSGDPGPGRTFLRVDPADGRPDGLAVSGDGTLWVAMAGAGRVEAFDPAGRSVHRVPVPVPNPTSCCFAGPDRDRLVITTARKRVEPTLAAAHPDLGRVFDAGPVGVTGLAQVPHRGALSSSPSD